MKIARRTPVKWYYMFVKKGFRKPKSVGIHGASFYQREMSQGRGTLYQIKARTADEARALIKSGKEVPAARPALKPRTPKRTAAWREAKWQEIVKESERVKPRGAREGIPEQMRLFGRVRYNRGDLNSTVKAAQKTVGKKPLYIFATAGGYTISKSKPPITQGYFLVKPDKTVETHNPEYTRKVEPEQMRLFGKVSYKPQAWERSRGKVNYYLSPAYLSDGSILFVEKHTVGEWLRRKETERIEYHAVEAYSRLHAQMIIEAGNSRPYYLSIGHHYRSPKAAEQLRLFGFSGLSGDISTCAYWIPTNGDWTCGSYLPTCEAQAPEACKVPPPDQYKFCATTQKVKSDPKGRYGGKLIKRCKTYRTRCMPESGCIPDKQFPKPEVFKLDKKEIQDIAASMAKEFNLLQKESGPALAREIMERGGLKAYRGESGTEEWAAMPLFMKRKEGSLTMDEMASEMGFEDETAFRLAVEKAYPPGKKTVRRKTWKDYEAEAKEILIEMEQRSEYAYEEPVPF